MAPRMAFLLATFPMAEVNKVVVVGQFISSEVFVMANSVVSGSLERGCHGDGSTGKESCSPHRKQRVRKQEDRHLSGQDRSLRTQP